MNNVELDFKYVGIKIRLTETSDKIEGAPVVGEAKGKI
jgi:hypothetical protein